MIHLIVLILMTLIPIYKDVEDGEMNVNLFEDSQVMQIDLMEEPIEEYETHV